MSIDAKVLLIHIQEHFSEVPYPGDDHIVIDDTGTHLECEDIKHKLIDHHWHELSFETLDQLHSALFFLSPGGYRFYLPAFMFYSVADFYRADVIPDEVIQTLTLPNESDIDQIRDLVSRHPEMQPFSSNEWEQLLKKMSDTYTSKSPERIFFARVSGFNLAQCKVIREVLDYMQHTYGNEFPNREPQIAIDRYWYRF